MYASIDIGTNTVLLLIATRENKTINAIHEEQRMPRLGQGVDQAKNLSYKARNRVIDALKEYKQLINNKFPQVKDLQVIATSAVRDAQNKQQFKEDIKAKTGLDMQILSGLEEAKYTFWGAQSVLQNMDPHQPKMIIDIGGGSTEMALGKSSDIIDHYSYDVGCVRFTERYLKSDPAKSEEINECREAIRVMLSKHKFKINKNAPIPLIGVSGTVTSLAYIDLNLQNYDSVKINGYRLSAKKIQQVIKEFRRYSSKRLLKKYPEVMEGRADIFLAGLLILEEVMKRYDFDSITASTGGIRHGAIIQKSF